jgi:EAL domain-containing protein (putative c-di-GMP-specific phosphodiesterase class I)
VSASFEPVPLGVPDVQSDEYGFSLWYDHALDFLGRPGLIGNIVLFGDLAVIVPPQPDPIMQTPWIAYEVISILPTTGAYWHRNGRPGLHNRTVQAGPMAAFVPSSDGAFYASACVPDGGTCVAMKAYLSDIVAAKLPAIALVIAVSAIIALAVSGQLHAYIRRFWSFESRFRRHFKPENIICTYQPILSIETGQISGCEVLVRWRDVDDSVIFPDQFLPIIAKHGLTRDLTRMVVRRAFDELSVKAPPHLRLQVNFNIAPADLDALWLRETLAVFDEAGDRFRIVVEIVESHEVQIGHAAREIEALRRFGIRTQLDDFGTGYSNIQNLASLPLDGVKLDRSFAMAEEGALMHRMMFSTIEMIHAAGHRLTVEGVESEERLRQLAATGHVQFAQGYHIARPLDIDRFVLVLNERAAASRPRLVA